MSQHSPLTFSYICTFVLCSIIFCYFSFIFLGMTSAGSDFVFMRVLLKCLLSNMSHQLNRTSLAHTRVAGHKANFLIFCFVFYITLLFPCRLQKSGKQRIQLAKTCKLNMPHKHQYTLCEHTQQSQHREHVLKLTSCDIMAWARSHKEYQSKNSWLAAS